MSNIMLIKLFSVLTTLAAAVYAQTTLLTVPTSSKLGMRLWRVGSTVSLISTQVQSSTFTSFYSTNQSETIAFSGDDQGKLYMWLINTTTNSVVLQQTLRVL